MPLEITVLVRAASSYPRSACAHISRQSIIVRLSTARGRLPRAIFRQTDVSSPVEICWPLASVAGAMGNQLRITSGMGSSCIRQLLGGLASIDCAVSSTSGCVSCVATNSFWIPAGEDTGDVSEALSAAGAAGLESSDIVGDLERATVARWEEDGRR
nr:hypothetical protein CFP56_56080 [Quercus suber]